MIIVKKLVLCMRSSLYLISAVAVSSSIITGIVIMVRKFDVMAGMILIPAGTFTMGSDNTVDYGLRPVENVSWCDDQIVGLDVDGFRVVLPR